MKPSHRKLVLTLHTTVTGAWIGSVAAYLALVVTAMVSADDGDVVSTWSALNLLARYVIVPVALASLLSGLIIALGTPWGLFKHKWVTASLGSTVAAVAVLLSHMSTVSGYATAAATSSVAAAPRLRQGLRGEFLHAGVGLLVLLAIQALNVYKPAGLTRHGRRQRAVRAVAAPVPTESAPMAPPMKTLSPSWGRIAWIHVGVLVALIAIGHAVIGGVAGH